MDDSDCAKLEQIITKIEGNPQPAAPKLARHLREMKKRGCKGCQH